MPSNPYTVSLEAALAAAKTRHWKLAKAVKSPWMFSGDDLDRRRGQEQAVRELQAVEREIARLHHELGKPMPHPGAISLAGVSHKPTTSRGAVKLTPAKRTVPTGYVTRMLGHPNCG